MKKEILIGFSVLAMMASFGAAALAERCGLWQNGQEQVDNGWTPGTGYPVTCDTDCYANPYGAQCDGDCFGAIWDHSQPGGGGHPIIWN